MSKSNPTMNQIYANSAQVVDIPKALETARFLIDLSNSFDKETELDLVNLWKFRAFAFLNRACELECQPVHRRLMQSLNGDLEEAWYSWKFVPKFYPDFDHDIESVFLGSCSKLTESQARMRSLS